MKPEVLKWIAIILSLGLLGYVIYLISNSQGYNDQNQNVGFFGWLFGTGWSF